MTTNEKTMLAGFAIMIAAIVAAEETRSVWCLLLFILGESVILYGAIQQMLARDREIYAEQLDKQDSEFLNSSKDI